MASLVIENAYLATVAGPEHRSGHLVVEGDTITAVGPGPAPDLPADGRADGRERIDATGCLLTPGLVNTHHHLYQWASQGLFPDATLFEWLSGSYPIWAGLDADIVGGAALAGLAWLAASGCTMTSDHPYLFPAGRGDLLGAEIDAAARVGLRFHPCRGSMDRGASSGGLPPDEVVEETGAALAATAEAIDRYHDPSRGSLLRIAVAPCSPFSVTEELMRESAELARRTGVRLHTHLAETLDEEEHCRAQFGRTPGQYVADLGWAGDDVWFAHCVHLHDEDIAAFAAAGTGTAHCPSSNGRLGAGIARIGDLVRAGAPVGVGVDGPASSELTPLAGELRQALLMQRAARGPRELTARQALELGTLGGARCLGRADELGTLEPGKLADLALWRVDGYRAALDDPVCALVLGPQPPLDLLLVGGNPIVTAGELRTVPATEAAAAGTTAHHHLTAH